MESEVRAPRRVGLSRVITGRRTHNVPSALSETEPRLSTAPSSQQPTERARVNANHRPGHLLMGRWKRNGWSPAKVWLNPVLPHLEQRFAQHGWSAVDVAPALKESPVSAGPDYAN